MYDHRLGTLRAKGQIELTVEDETAAYRMLRVAYTYSFGRKSRATVREAR